MSDSDIDPEDELLIDGRPKSDDEEEWDDTDKALSPASQIGRTAQTGGTPESGREPCEEVREGWSMPDEESHASPSGRSRPQ